MAQGGAEHCATCPYKHGAPRCADCPAQEPRTAAGAAALRLTVSAPGVWRRSPPALAGMGSAAPWFVGLDSQEARARLQGSAPGFIDAVVGLLAFIEIDACGVLNKRQSA